VICPNKAPLLTKGARPASNNPASCVSRMADLASRAGPAQARTVCTTLPTRPQLLKPGICTKTGKTLQYRHTGPAVTQVGHKRWPQTSGKTHSCGPEQPWLDSRLCGWRRVPASQPARIPAPPLDVSCRSHPGRRLVHTRRASKNPLAGSREAPTSPLAPTANAR